MTDSDYLARQSPKPPGPPPAPPKRTGIYLQTLMADKENELAKIRADLQHKRIDSSEALAKISILETELHDLRNELTAIWLDPTHKAHSNAHRREKAKS